jgi:hypothetical protein
MALYEVSFAVSSELLEDMTGLLSVECWMTALIPVHVIFIEMIWKCVGF